MFEVMSAEEAFSVVLNLESAFQDDRKVFLEKLLAEYRYAAPCLANTQAQIAVTKLLRDLSNGN
jgi:hypothetical protein